MLTILPTHRLNVIRYPRIVDADLAATLISDLSAGRMPTDFDNVMDTSGTERVDVPVDVMIKLAMTRRASLPAEPLRSVRNAVLAPNDAVRATLETWNMFFDETRRPILLKATDTLEEALDWIGKPEALTDVRAVLNGRS